MSDFYYDKLRQRQYSLASLREKIEDQFNTETGGRSDILSELDTRAKRLQAVGEVAEYILSTEYVDLPHEAKKQIIEQAVSNLFYFGELDPLLRDDAITEIAIEGYHTVLIRRGAGEMQKIPSPILNLPHLERLLTALIAPAQTALLEDHPFIEVGLKIYARPVRVSIIAPPVNPMYSVQIRLHPSEPLQIAVPPVLAARVAAGQGLMVTGAEGAGKTTLLDALLRGQSDLSGVVVVERAAEMTAPATRLTAIPVHPQEDRERDFAAQIHAAIQHHQPRCLVLDEIRGDESAAFWAALTAPQLMVAFRGGANPARLLSALSMVIRKSQPMVESEQVQRMILAKLPLVAVMQRSGESPQISFLGEWLQRDQTLSLVPVSD